MSTRKTVPLDGSLIVHKGAAVPARAAEHAREDPIAITVKLAPDLYWQLKHWGMRAKPRQTNQDIMVEALREFFRLRQAPDPRDS